jgi:hypothetical protein
VVFLKLEVLSMSEREDSQTRDQHLLYWSLLEL